jgi:hypothetical protein
LLSGSLKSIPANVHVSKLSEPRKEIRRNFTEVLTLESFDRFRVWGGYLVRIDNSDAVSRLFAFSNTDKDEAQLNLCALVMDSIHLLYQLYFFDYTIRNQRCRATVITSVM